MVDTFVLDLLNVMLKVKIMSDYPNSFPPNESEKNDKKIIKIFSIAKKIKTRKNYYIICGKYKKFKNPKITWIFEKTLVFSVIYSKWKIDDEKLFP